MSIVHMTYLPGAFAEGHPGSEMTVNALFLFVVTLHVVSWLSSFALYDLVAVAVKLLGVVFIVSASISYHHRVSALIVADEVADHRQMQMDTVIALIDSTTAAHSGEVAVHNQIREECDVQVAVLNALLERIEVLEKMNEVNNKVVSRMQEDNEDVRRSLERGEKEVVWLEKAVVGDKERVAGLELAIVQRLADLTAVGVQKRELLGVLASAKQSLTAARARVEHWTGRGELFEGMAAKGYASGSA
ncbi:hypothetical protein SISSUDRAFT_1053200 [Sistotremastrum suecicum HHB10207 ss-3]|uniref:Uncharacterized protein n=1 Tax=Sistotremastrum suecicum HHB10207 ss-3 TaxID=1314776 RepID=A0A165ZD37_9AGAM|nr:hypothetical protein SISSUDRAFT_1053200 [Sistotremastrum suecicum HHB10207 ss-3]